VKREKSERREFILLLVDQPKPVQNAILKPIDDFREAQLEAQAVANTCG